MASRFRLRRFRQGSILAIVLTGFLLTLWGVPAAPGQPPPASGVPSGTAGVPTGATNVQQPDATEPAAPEPAQPSAGPAGPLSQQPGAPQPASGSEDTVQADPGESAREATGTVRDLLLGLYGLLPKIGVAIVILLLAGGITHFARPLSRRLLGSWERGEAASALAGIAVWLLALGAAFSVIAGDARALVGLVGLFGLALSWALQTPIESVTGWLMNSFKSYYRIGDRIAVGEVFGDVFAIDFLTTTVWEVGGRDKPVEGEQATGALITFPNSEVLRANIVNFTRDFPFVWDEITINVANESDLAYTARVFRAVADRVVGEAMSDPAERYRRSLEDAGFAYDIATEPRVFFAITEAFTNATVRYLIPARERRIWSSRLFMALSAEVNRPEHRNRIVPGYPRTQVQITREMWQAEPGRGQV